MSETQHVAHATGPWGDEQGERGSLAQRGPERVTERACHHVDPQPVLDWQGDLVCWRCDDCYTTHEPEAFWHDGHPGWPGVDGEIRDYREGTAMGDRR